ncbi:MAG TPA: hypothetical protein VI461_12265 [Chitinophagaceae bacterium]|nr:hypothetical protein [Chitinophagaceae bacterium]
MKKSRLLQGLTLLSFLFFITVFVLYRAGKFDSYLSHARSQLQTSPNGGNISVKTDTLPGLLKDSSDRPMLSSSKLVIPADQKLSFMDSVKQKRRLDSLTKKNKRIMMSGSKSGQIFIPSFKLNSDSLKSDNLKKIKN